MQQRMMHWPVVGACLLFCRFFGLEAARIILGHRSAGISEVYAETDEQQAVGAIIKIG